jgi:hypothetical protein
LSAKASDISAYPQPTVAVDARAGLDDAASDRSAMG